MSFISPSALLFLKNSILNITFMVEVTSNVQWDQSGNPSSNECIFDHYIQFKRRLRSPVGSPALHRTAQSALNRMVKMHSFKPAEDCVRDCQPSPLEQLSLIRSSIQKKCCRWLQIEFNRIFARDCAHAGVRKESQCDNQEAHAENS
jgi:hypothetical protein